MDDRTETDEALLHRIAEGDRSAFPVLYRRHLNAVIAFVRRRVPEPDLAFDVAAETFAAVALNAAAYRGPGPAAAWIYGIARNQLAMAFRHRRVEDQARRRLRLEPVALTDEDLVRVEERSAVGMAALHEAMAQLPELTRQALMARIVDERDYGEIAVQLECSQQVVRQRVHRGLVHLRATIGEQP